MPCGARQWCSSAGAEPGKGPCLQNACFGCSVCSSYDEGPETCREWRTRLQTVRAPLCPPSAPLRRHAGDLGVAWGRLSCPAPHEEGEPVWAAPSALGGSPHLDGADGAPTVCAPGPASAAGGAACAEAANPRLARVALGAAEPAEQPASRRRFRRRRRRRFRRRRRRRRRRRCHGNVHRGRCCRGRTRRRRTRQHLGGGLLLHVRLSMRAAPAPVGPCAASAWPVGK